MAALITGVGDADLSGSELVGETEEPAVWAGIGAETLLSQKINRHKSADKEKRNGDGNGRKGSPKIGGDQMVGKIWNKRLVLSRRKEPICGWPNEHIERGDERDKDQQPRSKRFWREADFL